MKLYSIIIILTLLTAKSFAQSGSNVPTGVIGRIYHKINELSQFENYKEMEGAAILPIKSDYCLSKITDGRNVIILLDKVIHMEDGKVNYKIVDAINIGKQNNEVIMMTSCKINKKADPEIIGAAKYAEKENYTNLLRVWRANRKTNKIEQISVKGITCVDEGYAETD